MFGQHGLLHSNDEFGASVLVISPAILRKVVELSETLGGHNKKTSVEQAEISLSIINTVECRLTGYLLNKESATRYFDRLREALSGLEEEVLQFDAWRARTNL